MTRVQSKTRGTRGRKLAALACAGVCSLTSALASANGRFPAAQQLVVNPGNPNRIWLRATHGLLTSADRGASWRWICEKSIGYGGTDDPAIAVTESGTLLAGIFKGMPVTRDDGCNFEVQPTIGRQNVVDVTVEKGDAKQALALTSTGDGTGNYVSQVWRSSDSGATWNKLTDNLDPILLGLTIDPAPSDPKRVYVTGSLFQQQDAGVMTQGVLYRSEDGGETWVRRDIPDTDNINQPYLSAVDPANPDILYVRVRGPNATAPSFVENRLIYSDDGGESWRELLRDNADFLGFALAPDGKTVFIGMGDSREPGNARPVDETVLGIYRSPAPAFDFKRVSDDPEHPAVGHIGCLTFDGEDLWVCGSQFDQGFELGRSSDRGQTIEPLMELDSIEGPVICPCETSTGSSCVSEWPDLCTTIGRCESGDPGPPAYCGDPPETGPTGGAGGTAGGDGGGDGCGCRAPGSAGHTAGALGAVLGLLGVLLGLRRMRTAGRRRG
jgi:photosystem II stability/assembly factor-like uncharacterized protein